MYNELGYFVQAPPRDLHEMSKTGFTDLELAYSLCNKAPVYNPVIDRDIIVFDLR